MCRDRGSCRPLAATTRVSGLTIFASRSNGFAVIDADANQLTVSLVDGNGATVYTDTLKKDATAVSDR